MLCMLLRALKKYFWPAPGGIGHYPFSTNFIRILFELILFELLRIQLILFENTKFPHLNRK